ncbi:hypothetical protein BSLG_001253 [Batrachochytrium salamandrivorans]|nr:hypothetical protein BSLG_001253 [Batrachochytrium salamandrivorans]
MATNELSSKWLKQSDSIINLLQIVSLSVSIPVRQLAAVELRKLIEKNDGKSWLQLSESVQHEIKAGILSTTINQEKVRVVYCTLVRHALARVISEIAKIEITNHRWFELIDALNNLCSSQLYLRELMSSRTISTTSSTVLALGKMAEFVEDAQSASFMSFRDLIPKIAQVMQRALAQGDDISALKIFEFFEGLLLLEMPFLSKHFGELVSLYVGISSTATYADETRVMAMSFIMLATTYAKSKLTKLGLVPSIISAILPIAAEDEPEDREDQYPGKTAIQLKVVPIICESASRKFYHLSSMLFKMGHPQCVEQLALLLALADDPDLRFNPLFLERSSLSVEALDDLVLSYVEPITTKLVQLLSSIDRKSVLASVNCIGSVARASGPWLQMRLPPPMSTMMELAINGINIDNSQLRECSYLFFGTLARLFGASSFEALGLLFSATRGAFMPFVSDSANAALSSLENFNDDVRISASQCLLRFFVTMQSMANTSAWQAGLSAASPVHENVASAIRLPWRKHWKLIGPVSLGFEYSGSSEASMQHVNTLAEFVVQIFRGEHVCQISEDLTTLPIGTTTNLQSWKRWSLVLQPTYSGALAAVLDQIMHLIFHLLCLLFAKTSYNQGLCPDLSIPPLECL